MRIPISWLRDYVDLPDSISAEEVLDTLIKVGIEEEAIHRSEVTGPVVVGQVLSIEKETASNGKTINWCQVQVAGEGQTAADGGAAVHGIVCGAHNFSEGDKVVVVLHGAELPGGFSISARKTYGHVSEGMIASVRELGIGDDHDGILVLSSMGLDPEVGTDALPLLGLDEEAAEVEITPDRGYQLSMRGIARSWAQATDTTFVDPAAGVEVPENLGSGYPGSIDDAAPIYGVPGAARLVLREVSGLNPATTSPDWLRSRLSLAGIRSISLPVDVSNYVMLELGQPLHFYDADTLNGAMVVRRAKEQETLLTLDEKERSLNPEDLVIADDSGAIGLAGVMGGASTEVSDSTTRVVIEAAAFDPVSIGRSRRRHKLPSEAAKRFERGVDPAIAPIAAQRAATLLAELAGGEVPASGTDLDQRVPAPLILVPKDAASTVLGREISTAEVEKAFERMGAEFTSTESGWQITPPSWRPDIVAVEDVVEDIAVLTGYDNIGSQLPVPPAGKGYAPDQRRWRRLMQLLADASLVEVVTLPFVSEQANKIFGHDAMFSLVNPTSSEFGYLRTSLLPGLAEALKRNADRGFKDAQLYEGGQVFWPEGELGTADLPALGQYPGKEAVQAMMSSLGQQPRTIAGILAPPAVWQDALDYALLIPQALGLNAQLGQAQGPGFHPGRCAHIVLDDVVLGFAGELHPETADAFGIPRGTVAFELALEEALAKAKPAVAQALSAYPVATQDVALLVDEQVPAGDVAQALREGAGELLEDIELFEDYRGVGEGKKSLAFGLRFRAADRTLKAEEATQARAGAVALAAERFGAVQR